MGIELVVLHTESRCNLDCTYCYTRGRRARPNRLDVDTAVAIIRQARELGAWRAVFAGPGEPLMGDQTLELVDCVHRLGMQPVLFTNGVALDDGRIEFLRARNTALTLKLHALSKQRYDALAGRPTTFAWEELEIRRGAQSTVATVPVFLAKLLRGGYGASGLDARSLWRVVRHGPRRQLLQPRLLRLETVVTKTNLDDVPMVARLAQHLGVELLVETLIETEELDRQLVPTARQYQQLFAELSRLLSRKWRRSQADGSCPLNRNAIVFEDGRVGRCLVVPSSVSWFESRSLARALAQLPVIASPRGESPPHGFRSCYGREQAR